MGRRRGGKSNVRRVVLQDPRLKHPLGGEEYFQSIKSDRHPGEAKRTHPVCRLTEHGVDYGVEPRPGDETAYGMDPYRCDDCLSAAIATALQVPIEQVPDLKLDERLSRGADPDELNLQSWERIDRWANQRGLSLQLHSQVPLPRDRWIGVVVLGDLDPGDGFNDHCLVMCHDRVVFDASCSVRPPDGMRLMTFEASDVAYGISFDREETNA